MEKQSYIFHLNEYFNIMLCGFSPKELQYRSYYEFLGYYTDGQLVVNEIVKPGVDENAKGKCLIIKKNIHEKDLQELIIKTPNLNGVLIPLNFDWSLDLKWLLPIASSITQIADENYLNKKLLNEFTNLKCLCIKGSDKLNISALSNLIDLFAMYVDYEKITFSNLSSLIHLRSMHCKKIHCFPFHSCKDLKYLDFTWDLHLKSLDFIQILPQLEMVQLFHTSKIEEWPDSSGLEKLHTVYLENANRLTDLTGLSKAPNLKCLHMFTKTKLSRLEPFLDCKSLKYILFNGTKAEINEARRLFPGVQFNSDRPKDCQQFGIIY